MHPSITSVGPNTRQEAVALSMALLLSVKFHKSDAVPDRKVAKSGSTIEGYGV